MATVKQWEGHFEQQSPQKLEGLMRALETLRADKMFEENYHNDFYNLQYSIRWVLENKSAVEGQVIRGELR